MALVVLAVGAHPDDIEFVMSGTLIRLRDAGAELHYMHLSSGSCGSMTLPPEKIASVRKAEARRAAAMLGAVYHPSIADDIEIFYEDSLIRRLAAVVREVRPDCLLAPSPVDYMEDHQNTARLAATAAFCRSIPNYRTVPPVSAVDTPLAVYHAMPYGLAGPLGEAIIPEFLVDVTDTRRLRAALLEAHGSQRSWLDASQGVGSYIDAMLGMSRELALHYPRVEMAGDRETERVTHAEGWRRRLHLGFCSPDYRPLESAISDWVYRPGLRSDGVG